MDSHRFGVDLPLISLSMLMFGTQTVYSRLRGAYQSERDDVLTAKQHALESLRRGCIGGYLGSLVAAVGFSTLYDMHWRSDFHDAARAWVEKSPVQHDSVPAPLAILMIEIVPATAVTACVLGFLTLFFARISLTRGQLFVLKAPSPFRTIKGALVGGALSGIICAPVLTIYFGTQSGPKVLPDILVPIGIIGASIFVFSIVNFDFERLSSRRLIVGFASALAGIIVAGAASVTVFGLLYFFGIVDLIAAWLSDNSESVAIMILGGMLYGIPVGLALGAVIGIAIALSGRWEQRDFFQSHASFNSRTWR